MTKMKVQVHIERDEWEAFDAAVAVASGDADPKLTKSSELRRLVREYIASHPPAVSEAATPKHESPPGGAV